jgi:polyketide cyclase/dehydrase/lipid transport protein
VTTIRVVTDSALAPGQVLEAAHDFSERRAAIFPAVEIERLEVHENATSTAEVTEGTGVGPLGANWERCRYDWSQPDKVTAIVVDSNVYAFPGSSWEITAKPKGDGSEIEMTWIREFNHRPRGLLFGTAFRAIGNRMFRKYARDVVDNLERVSGASSA